MSHRYRWSTLVVTLLASLAACSSSIGDAPGVTITRSAGDQQTAAAGTPVQIPPAVLVADAAQRPLANIPVTFAVTSGGGRVISGTQMTNSSGVATLGNWILGATPGDNTLSAKIDTMVGASVVFVAHGTAVPTDAHLSAIATGGSTACGINIAGASYCWGSAAGTNQQEFIATLVEPAVTMRAVAAGDQDACVLSTGGVAYCWGANGSGQVGDGTTVDRSAPVRVAGGHSFQVIATGGGRTCALTPAGAAFCWGSVAGSVGAQANLAPAAMAGGLTFQAIAVSDTHVCALTTDGIGYCWGDNGNGELGDGTTASSPLPVAVAGGLTFKSITAGSAFSCGLTTGGSAYCWGRNQAGQLGDGSVVDHALPAAVAGGFAWQGIAAGAAAARACGVTTLNAAYCWGQNANGELGDGTNADRHVPTAVTGGVTFISVTTGANRTCGTSTVGVAYCWGLAPLGDGTTSASLVPVVVKAQ